MSYSLKVTLCNTINCFLQCLEQTLVMERARFEASDSGKSTASNTPQEPAHEVANLIDDYKKVSVFPSDWLLLTFP